MDWLNTINKTTEYIEEHIGDSIDFEEFSKSINVSYFYLLKMFKTITNVGLKEYVKNRRLSVSCYDLLNTNSNILDIAIKYGYSSNEAFTRAFKTFHGVTPKDVRNNSGLLKQYPMIHFKLSNVELTAIQFNILNDYNVQLYGRKMRYTEDNSMYQVKRIDQFIRDSEMLFTGEIVYTAKTNYSKDNGHNSFDVFIGVKNKEHNNLDTLEKTVDKVILYKAKGNHPFSLKSLKQKIIDEWGFNSLKFNRELELEYIYETDNGFEMEYIVSIE